MLECINVHELDTFNKFAHWSWHGFKLRYYYYYVYSLLCYYYSCYMVEVLLLQQLHSYHVMTAAKDTV